MWCGVVCLAVPPSGICGGTQSAWCGTGCRCLLFDARRERGREPLERANQCSRGAGSQLAYASWPHLRIFNLPALVPTGHGLGGGVGRCYSFFVDFSECMAKAGDPTE